MREREPRADESFRPAEDPSPWPLAEVPDLSLVLGHGADAPDPADLGEPASVTEALSKHVAFRLSRRQMLATGAVGVAAGALGQTSAAVASGREGRRSKGAGRGTAATLSAGLEVDYLREVTETLTGFGDTPDGWRPGGSPASLEAVDWIADEMRAVGMTQVAKLPVPIDRWVFHGASVAVPGGATYNASSWGGVPGTPAGGITAEVLDLGLGQAADYEGVDATGKIVLVNWAYGDYWVNRHGHQATLEGALAVIFYTGTTAAGAFYNVRDDGLLSFDGTYDDDWVPFVFVTRNAANDLRASIAGGPTTVTLTSNVELTRAEDGGVGYNVLGAIRGTDRADEFIIFTGHHDAWFHGAADDATAVAAMLGIGKAVRETGFRPRRTLLFLASTNEEYGYTDAYYEWLIGCWYAVTQQRPDWRRKAILSLDFELLGTGDPGERLLIRTHSELLAHAVEKQLSDPSRTPFGALSQNVVWANADHFTLTAAGIPGIYFNTVGTQYLTRNYHTNYDVIANVNFDYLRQNIEVINDIWVDHDRSSLPLLDFVARATEAESRVAYEAEAGVTLADLPGVDQRAVTRLSSAVASFRSAAEALDAQLATGRPHRSEQVGKAMLGVERDLLTELVALDVFDQYVFPHQQLQRDVTRMDLAVTALESGDPALANNTYVRRTGLTSAGRLFAYEAYVAELARHEPSSDRLQWGGQAHLASYVDLWQEFHSISAKIDAGLTDPADYADEIASLRSKQRPVYRELNRRLARMARVFEGAARGLRKAVRHAEH
jgi:Peptidase family M28/PA domain